jgi:biotin carboxylase
MKARNFGILVPEFTHVVNDEEVRHFAETVPLPWMLKPRSQAAAIGMKKIERVEEVWPAIEALGDRRSFYLLERFVAGDVYHVDSIVWNKDVVFQKAHRYGAPPFQVAHGGGVFMTRTVPDGTPEFSALARLNRDVMTTFGLMRGVAHTEFIRSAETGRFLFLETSARVGGAYIVDLVQAETDLNLWREWARLEIEGEDGHYVLPAHQHRFAGLILTLARQEWPDTSAYGDPEVVYRIKKANHAGLIVASEDLARIDALLAQYSERFARDFMAFAPAPEKPPA